ncbi:MAG: uroporphyrinogen decarboxylase, partial [Alphaproteobacteria bacterium]|nr:uroporphyrinogen decarboxylase [Alphaproteobacteria bacterium]
MTANAAGRPEDKALLRVLRGESRMPPAIWFMRQAGRYLPEYRALRAEAGGFLDLVFDPVRAAEVTLQPVRRFGFDAAILFSDILVVPYALGQDLRFVEGEGPRLTPIRAASDMAGLSDRRLHDVLGPIYETVAAVKSRLPAPTALIGFAGAPWTVACYMVEGGGSRDFVEVRRLAYGDPEAFAGLIDRLVDATGDYLVRQVEAGAEVLQLFDSWAGVLSPPAFARWVVAPTRRLVDRLRRDVPGVPIIGFPRGGGPHLAAYHAETGVDAIAMDTGIPPGWARQALGSQTVLQGNLDPVVLMLGGPALDRETDAVLAALHG